jgi:hypothetical protein
MPRATYHVEVYLDPDLWVEAKDLEHAVSLAKEAVFRDGLCISVERTYDEGEALSEDDEGEQEDFHWNISQERFNPENDGN